MRRLYRRVASSEPATYTITHSQASTDALVISVQGGDAEEFQSTNNGGTGSTTTALGLTTPRDESYVGYISHNWDLFGGASPPAGSSPVFAEVLDSAASIWYYADGALATAGATGDKTQSNLNSQSFYPWGAFLVSVGSAQGGASVEGDVSFAASAGASPTGNADVSGSAVFAGAAAVSDGSAAQMLAGASFGGAAEVVGVGVRQILAATVLSGLAQHQSAGRVSIEGAASVSAAHAVSAGATQASSPGIVLSASSGSSLSAQASALATVILETASTLSPASTALCHVSSLLAALSSLRSVTGASTEDSLSLGAVGQIAGHALGNYLAASGLGFTVGMSQAAQAALVDEAVLSIQADVASAARQLSQATVGLTLSADQVSAAAQVLEAGMLIAAANVLEASSGSGVSYGAIRMIAVTLRTAALDSPGLQAAGLSVPALLVSTESS